MTSKLTITREQLTNWVSQLDSDGGCDATDRQLEALIRQSLATMDSEPVAYIDKQWMLVYYVPPMSLGLKIGDNLYRQGQPARDSCAIADIIAERQRQQSVEGFSTEQDDTYVGCQLAAAAICYIEPMEAMSYWPADWHDDSFKPTNERRNLVKAAALIIAEIERIDRKSNGRTE
ncbi:TPA: hypothetical protein MNC05_001591 [Klebsiella pneumoniae]|uniref:Uncharacterized protein n=1 Tax=Klebsiella michiganensis TaxID=1134687 RepID=A0A7H5ACP5_9ENTR|nr:MULTISPECIES: hypothetical protein [Klebsiella]DAK70628.1 MAG TPA: hypothetical protein [Caudoviricetes sp.]EKU2160843.1 hypothetical protein [Klebsiella pneumoniae]EWF90783.1 hypothetical protein L373_01163 [Klebsiella michiganensis]MDG9900796.1 hypothetical protein [Klebsiella grimontii]WDQ06535.1 hypothetical protein PVK22_03530 [Klebsiella oxytoca]